MISSSVKFFKTHRILLLVLFLASILRFYNLASFPALNADEAAIGYNAYSLLQTGKDEHGNSWPIHFQSFNDYKPGLYFYIVLPFVKVLGLTELAVRLPGALLGVATVLVVWLLVYQLFPKIKWLPELSALFLAISPWHLHFSRGGWEVNAATFFITLGFLFFLEGLEQKRWLLWSVVAFVASLYTYHAARIVVPLLVLSLLIMRWKVIFSGRTWVRTAILGILLCVPLFLSLLGTEARARAAGVGLFADKGPLNRINQQRGEHASLESRFSRLMHNKAVNYSLAFFQNYFSHFQGEFLFLSGDEIQRDKVPEIGQLYLLDLVFLLVGFWAIAKNSSGWSPILLWIVFAPTAAALTFQSPHGLRAENMVVPLVIVSAYGVLGLLGWLRRITKRRSVLITGYCLLATLIFWDFTRYLHEYWVHMSKTYDFSSQYGAKELVSYTQDNWDKYPKFVVTNRYDQPYILFLFYLKYPPERFQKGHKLAPRDEFGFSTVENFDKFRFLKVSPWEKIRTEHPGALIVGTPQEIPDGANVVREIYFPSGRIAYKAVAN